MKAVYVPVPMCTVSSFTVDEYCIKDGNDTIRHYKKNMLLKDMAI